MTRKSNTTASPKELHKKINFLFTHRKESLTIDDPYEHIVFTIESMQTILTRDIRSQAEALLETARQGIVLTTNILSKLGFGKTHDSRGYLQWVNPDDPKTGSLLFDFSFSDWPRSAWNRAPLTCIDLKSKTNGISAFIQIVNKDDTVTFLCPFKVEEDNQCSRAVDKLFLPPGAQQFGCQRCHAVDVGDYWKSFEYKEEYRRSKEEASAEDRKHIKKALLRGCMLRFDVPSLARGGFFTVKSVDRNMEFQMAWFGPKEERPQPLKLRCRVVPDGKGQWKISLSGKLGERRIRSRFEVQRTERVRGRGKQVIWKALCPHPHAEEVCGRTDEALRLPPTATEFCCDQCADSIYSWRANDWESLWGRVPEKSKKKVKKVRRSSKEAVVA